MSNKNSKYLGKYNRRVFLSPSTYVAQLKAKTTTLWWDFQYTRGNTCRMLQGKLGPQGTQSPTLDAPRGSTLLQAPHAWAAATPKQDITCAGAPHGGSTQPAPHLGQPGTRDTLKAQHSQFPHQF